MTTERRTLRVRDLQVAVERKAIKNLHLGVYPPHGRVRVAAPHAVSDAAVRVAVITKLSWIRKQRASFAEQARESERSMVSGESHYFLGQRYRLVVNHADGPSEVVLRSKRLIELRVRSELDDVARRRVLERWYRSQLKAYVLPLIEKWAGNLNVTVAAWGIKRMKTKWGSCNSKARRIWLNLELAKKPPECVEYLILHELAHLRAPRHDARFLSLMDRHMPRWRSIRKSLNATPLGTEQWDH